MTSVDKDAWHRWLDETGHDFNIAAFYYDDQEVRFPLVTVALWLEQWTDAMESFLSRFEPDSDDIALARMELSKAHDATARAVLQRWLAAKA